MKLWMIVLGLAFGVSITNGLARVAYGLVLPAMQSDLGWSYTQAGWISTANALGYLVGAVLTLLAMGRVRQEQMFACGVVATTVTILANGLTADFWWLSFWRVLSGLFAAPVFIAAGALAANVFGADMRRNALSIALAFGGGGIGMVIAAGVIPMMIDRMGVSYWPQVWWFLGGLSVVFCPLALWASRHLSTPVRTLEDAPAPPLHAQAFEMGGYFMFATGYLVYLTFLSAWMRVLDAGAGMVSAVWMIVGVGTIVSSFLWRPVMARFSSGVPLALTNGCVAVGTVLPVIFPTMAGVLASAVVFGLSVFMPPTAITNFLRKNNPPASWGRVMAVFTVIFAVGQCIGPVTAGLIGDAVGTIGAGMLAAGGILAVGAVLGLMQRQVGVPAAASGEESAD